ncbi:MAG: transcription antitermination factor NusB [Planctomycetota bacterium]
MSLRSRAREVALQILFEDDVNPRQTAAELEQFVAGRLNNPEGEAFALTLILGVRRNQAELDAAISQIADNWSLNRMAPTDRNCLRLGAYEILYGETPYKVAINEAVELAKRFGRAQSAAFVNGILDKLPRGDSETGSQGTE